VSLTVAYPTPTTATRGGTSRSVVTCNRAGLQSLHKKEEEGSRPLRKKGDDEGGGRREEVT
jgi:hypothetical protein